MMAAPFLQLVAWAAFLALTAGAVLARTMPPRMLVACLVIKFLVPVVYFAWFADGTWTLIDDLRYLRVGLELAGQGYTPFSVFLSRHGLGQLFLLSEGVHVMYGWFNLLAVTLIGPYYYSPVILNVFITCLSARVLWGFAVDAGYGPRYSSGLTAFYLLHWDVVAWSSFVNVKDSIIVLLTLLLLRALARFQRAPARRELVRAALVSLALVWIRFYVPAIAGLAVLIQAVTGRGFVPRHRRAFMLGAFAMVLVMGWFIQSRWLGIIRAQIHWSPGQVSLGLVRMLMTPQPWSVSPEYGFLLIPSILHLIMLVPAIAGASMLWRESPMLRLPIIYMGLILLLFAAFPGEQGPRYRHQAVFVLVWAQFTFAWHLLRALAQGAFTPPQLAMRLPT
jgi:hypothetical protein